MSISFDLPESLEAALRAEWGDLDQAAKEALIIESYRTGRLSIGQVAEFLRLETRFQAEKWLGERGVTWNYSSDDLKADRETLNSLLPRRA